LYLKSFPLQTDEAPDTGEDSDDDLITSYIGGGNGDVDPAGVPSISVTAANGNRILGNKEEFERNFLKKTFMLK